MKPVHKYCPSSGTEGMGFMALWCEKCAFESWGDTPDTWCPILCDSFLYDTDDPKFPSQWQYDDEGKPVCTSFRASDDESSRDARNEKIAAERIKRGKYAGAPETKEAPDA